MAFKLRGSPMARNYGYPFKDKDPHTGEDPTHGEHKSIKETVVEGEKKVRKMVWDAATGKWVRDLTKKVVESIPISIKPRYSTKEN